MISAWHLTEIENRLISRLDRLEVKLNRVLGYLSNLSETENLLMAKVQDVQAAVAAETTVVQSAVVLLGSLHDQLVAAQSDPAALQAVIDSIGQNKDALAQAVVANTPAAPPAPPAP